MSSEDQKRSGVRIYRAADAPDLGQSGFSLGTDFGGHTELKDVVQALSQAARVTTRVLVRQSRDEGGFSLVYLFFKPHFTLFRHKHEDDCMYIVLSGTAVMGNQTLRAGDCFFVPAMAPYSYTAGPDGIEVLEIRHNSEGFTTIFASNPESRLEEARKTLEDNEEAWKRIEAGPMMLANAARD